MPGQTATTVWLQVAVASQISLGIVFLLSVLPKLRRPLAFARSVIGYEILPDKAASAFALILIPVEAFLAVAFLTGWLTDIALPLAAVMLLMFLVAVGMNLRRDRRVPCGCFGDASERISPRTLARLLLLLIVVLLLIAFKAVNASWPDLGAMIAGAAARTDLLPTVCLAAFLILAAA